MAQHSAAGAEAGATKTNLDRVEVGKTEKKKAKKK
jgi:hypothetical protein